MEKIMTRLTRRGMMISGLAVTQFGIAGLVQAQEALAAPAVSRNLSSFVVHNWQDHFPSLRHGAILSDTSRKFVQYWPEDGGEMKLYPSSVPLSDDLTRLGATVIVEKREGPTWAPTPAMKLRNPEWPDFMGPGPDNPMGTHALYLSWQYYRVHGTNDTRKIGRKSSNGCIGLYNEHIEELFALARVGTQVKLI